MVLHIQQTLKRHWAVFALAVCVSAIYGSHYIFIPRVLGGEKAATYHPLTFTAHPDAAFYGLRANAVYQGEWRTGDVSVVENADSPWMLPPFGAWLIGGMGRMLGSLDRAFILSDILFPPLIFMALYFLAFEMTRVRALSLFFAAFFVSIPMAILAFPPVTPSLMRTLIERVMPESASILYFARLEYPKTTFLFYALAMYGALRAIRRNERWSAVLAGVSFGLMFYTYLYDWVYFLVGISLTGAVLALTKQYRACRRLAQIAGIGFIISLPYWYNMFLLRQLPHYGELEARIGIETGWAFRWATVWKGYARVVLLAMLTAAAVPRTERSTLWHILGLLAAFVGVVNLQVVLGFNPHPDHWYRISFLPIAMAMLAAGFWAGKRWVSPRVLAYGGAVALACVALLFGRSLVSQYQYSMRDGHAYALDPAYAASYAWLSREAPKNATVAALNFMTNNELGLHTPQKTYVLNAVHTTVSDEEIWRRYARVNAAMGVLPEHFAKLIQGDPVLFHLTHNTYRDNSFDSSFRYTEGQSVRRLPEERYKRLVIQYAALFAAGGSDAKQGPDYLLVGPREDTLTLWVVAKNMREVYDAGGVRIYQAIRQ